MHKVRFLEKKKYLISYPLGAKQISKIISYE